MLINSNHCNLLDKHPLNLLQIDASREKVTQHLFENLALLNGLDLDIGSTKSHVDRF